MESMCGVHVCVPRTQRWHGLRSPRAELRDDPEKKLWNRIQQPLHLPEHEAVQLEEIQQSTRQANC